MEFVEDQSFSPMKNSIIDQSSRIYEIVSNASKFKKYYNELVNNIIDSMNNQCASYERNSKKSIKIDIYDNVMESINWDGLQKQLVDDLKRNRSVRDTNLTWHDIGDLNSFVIEKYDIDPIINMYSNYGEESVKEYAKYMKEAINNLNEIRTYIDEFEQGLCDYRSNAVRIILEKTPPEISSDIIDAGIYITGGSANIKKIDELFASETELDVRVAVDPANTVVNGLGRILEDNGKYGCLAFSLKQTYYGG